MFTVNIKFNCCSRMATNKTSERERERNQVIKSNISPIWLSNSVIRGTKWHHLKLQTANYWHHRQDDGFHEQLGLQNLWCIATSYHSLCTQESRKLHFPSSEWYGLLMLKKAEQKWRLNSFRCMSQAITTGTHCSCGAREDWDGVQRLQFHERCLQPDPVWGSFDPNPMDRIVRFLTRYRWIWCIRVRVNESMWAQVN